MGPRKRRLEREGSSLKPRLQQLQHHQSRRDTRKDQTYTKKHRDRFLQGSLENVSCNPLGDVHLQESSLRRSRSLAISREDVFTNLEIPNSGRNRRSQLIPRAKLIDRCYSRDRCLQRGFSQESLYISDRKLSIGHDYAVPQQANNKTLTPDYPQELDSLESNTYTQRTYTASNENLDYQDSEGNSANTNSGNTEDYEGLLVYQRSDDLEGVNRQYLENGIFFNQEDERILYQDTNHYQDSESQVPAGQKAPAYLQQQDNEEKIYQERLISDKNVQEAKKRLQEEASLIKTQGNLKKLQNFIEGKDKKNKKDSHLRHSTHQEKKQHEIQQAEEKRRSLYEGQAGQEDKRRVRRLSYQGQHDYELGYHQGQLYFDLNYPNQQYQHHFDVHTSNLDLHALSQRDFDVHALSQRDFDAHALSQRDFDAHALSQRDFDAHALSQRDFDAHALSQRDFDVHALSQRDFDALVSKQRDFDLYASNQQLHSTGQRDFNQNIQKQHVDAANVRNSDANTSKQRDFDASKQQPIDGDSNLRASNHKLHSSEQQRESNQNSSKQRRNSDAKTSNFDLYAAHQHLHPAISNNSKQHTNASKERNSDIKRDSNQQLVNSSGQRDFKENSTKQNGFDEDTAKQRSSEVKASNQRNDLNSHRNCDVKTSKLRDSNAGQRDSHVKQRDLTIDTPKQRDSDVKATKQTSKQRDIDAQTSKQRDSNASQRDSNVNQRNFNIETSKQRDCDVKATKQTSKQRDIDAETSKQRDFGAYASHKRHFDIHATSQENLSLHSTKQRDIDAETSKQRDFDAQPSKQRDIDAQTSKQRDFDPRASSKRNFDVHAASQEDLRQHSSKQRDFDAHASNKRHFDILTASQEDLRLHSLRQRDLLKLHSSSSSGQRDLQAKASNQGQRDSNQHSSSARRDSNQHSSSQRDFNQHSSSEQRDSSAKKQLNKPDNDLAYQGQLDTGLIYQDAGLNLPNYYPDSKCDTDLSITDNVSDKGCLAEVSYDENIVFAKNSLYELAESSYYKSKPRTIRGNTPYEHDSGNFKPRSLPNFEGSKGYESDSTLSDLDPEYYEPVGKEVSKVIERDNCKENVYGSKSDFSNIEANPIYDEIPLITEIIDNNNNKTSEPIKTSIQVLGIDVPEEPDYKTVVNVSSEEGSPKEAKKHSHNYLKEFLETQKGSKKPLQNFLSKRISRAFQGKKQPPGNLGENQYFSLPDITVSKNLQKCEKIDRKLRKAESKAEAKNRFIVNIGNHFDVTAHSNIPVDFELKISKIPKAHKSRKNNDETKRINKIIVNGEEINTEDLYQRDKEVEVIIEDVNIDMNGKEINKEYQEKVHNMRNYWGNIVDSKEKTDPVKDESDGDEKKCKIVGVHTKVDEVKKKFEPQEEKKEAEKPSIVQMNKQIFEKIDRKESSKGLLENPYFEREQFESLNPNIVEIVEAAPTSHPKLAKSRSVLQEPQFDHVRYRVMKSDLFQKKIFANCEKESQFDGLMQYLQDYSFQELLIDNNIVIIEPIRTNVQYIGGAKSKAARNVTQFIHKPGKPEKTSESAGLKRHFFYHPIRVNREVNDDELPNPDTVKQVRQMFEGVMPRSQSCSKDLDTLTKQTIQYRTIDPDKDRCSATDSNESNISDFGSSDNIFDNHCCDQYVSEDILEKIRQYGTSVTYYGGRVVNKRTGKSVSMTKAIMDEIQNQQKRRADCRCQKSKSVSFNDSTKESDSYQGVKFKLLKSNSCSSRLELVGTKNLAEYRNKFIAKQQQLLEEHRKKQIDKDAINETIREQSQNSPKIIGEEMKSGKKLMQWGDKSVSGNNITYTKAPQKIVYDYHGYEKVKPKARKVDDMEFEPYEIAGN